MTIYEATHDKVYPAKGQFCEDVLITPKDKIASLVNDIWQYSLHWPEGDGWVEQAKEDVGSEIVQAMKRVWELEQAKLILDKIEGDIK